MIRPINTKAATPADLSPEQKKLKEVAEEFEALFVETILKQARTASRALSGEEKSGMGRDVYEGWQDQHLARAITTGGGIGLAETLYRQLQQDQINKEASK